VGVVELEDDLLGEALDRDAHDPDDAEGVFEGAGDEEVLLFEAEALALGGAVFGVEDFGEVLGLDVVVDGAGVVAGVEDVEVERAGSAGSPQPEGVDGV
jgi:hypothetical protein